MKCRSLLCMILAVLTYVMMPAVGITNDNTEDDEDNDGTWTVSRANCVNNESTSQSLFTWGYRRVTSLHLDMYEETDHTVESSPDYEFGIRAAARAGPGL